MAAPYRIRPGRSSDASTPGKAIDSMIANDVDRSPPRYQFLRQLSFESLLIRRVLFRLIEWLAVLFFKVEQLDENPAKQNHAPQSKCSNPVLILQCFTFSMNFQFKYKGSKIFIASRPMTGLHRAETPHWMTGCI
ncbi:hypothetical protein [Burkholderia lata]|uniref:hypothetical protein n=1 Tax=Burkholderia lata (strain ATCC 17760 / DSM 23089 / LMG 22485 / NCIMB 9086 / R18194 / 383) TaxID=482957 RepID=UPI001581533D|nr:hypothetical protein [Burkholderia lata]